jgi:hypothetical protein
MVGAHDHTHKHANQHRATGLARNLPIIENAVESTVGLAASQIPSVILWSERWRNVSTKQKIQKPGWPQDQKNDFINFVGYSRSGGIRTYDPFTPSGENTRVSLNFLRVTAGLNHCNLSFSGDASSPTRKRSPASEGRKLNKALIFIS